MLKLSNKSIVQYPINSSLTKSSSNISTRSGCIVSLGIETFILNIVFQDGFIVSGLDNVSTFFPPGTLNITYGSLALLSATTNPLAWTKNILKDP